jgi:hypothetical protein
MGFASTIKSRQIHDARKGLGWCCLRLKIDQESLQRSVRLLTRLIHRLGDFGLAEVV